MKVGSLPPLQEPEAHDRFWPRPSSRSRSSLLLPASRPIAGGADVFMNICAPAWQLSDHQASHMRRNSSGARSSMACVQETRYDSAKGRQQVQTLLSNVEAYHAMRLLERVRLRQITYSTRQHSFNPEKVAAVRQRETHRPGRQTCRLRSSGEIRRIFTSSCRLVQAGSCTDQRPPFFTWWGWERVPGECTALRRSLSPTIAMNLLYTLPLVLMHGDNWSSPAMTSIDGLHHCPVAIDPSHFISQ